MNDRNTFEPISFLATKNHRPGGGLFVGLRFHYATRVINDRWKLKKVDGREKFVKVPPFNVWHLDIGLLTHTISIYIRRKTK